jgi:hypothetical protein
MTSLCKVILVAMMAFTAVPVLYAADHSPTIDEVSYGDQYSNCFKGASFFVKTKDMNFDTELQIFESMNGKDFFLFKNQTKPYRSSGQWYEFKCPQSSFESSFQVRLVNSTHAGNTALVKYSSGPTPHIDNVEYKNGIVEITGYYLDGIVEVIYDGQVKGQIYGKRNSLIIPATIHKNIQGLYKLRNIHGTSESFLLRPYAQANFGFATTPALNHNIQLRNNCKNFYNQTQIKKIESLKGICSLNNTYAFWGLTKIASSDDDLSVFVDIPENRSNVQAISPSGYGSRVELVVAIDSYQVQKYPEYMRQSISSGFLTKSLDGSYSLQDIHFVPLYKAIFLGEPNVILNAQTSIAAHVVLDRLSLNDKPEIIGEIYQKALVAPAMQSAVNRYNYLLTQSVVVDYSGRQILHAIASPLYIQDSQLNSLIDQITLQVGK